MPQSPDSLITVKELSHFLHCTERTIYNWIAAEKIPFYKIGTDYRFDKQAVIDTLPRTRMNKV